MGAPRRQDAAPVSGAPLDRLYDEPHRFDPFQAVRLLVLSARKAARGSGADSPVVGEDSAPRDEAVRFRETVSLAFPPGAISRLERGAADDGRRRPPELFVSHIGFVGASGVLPDHYTTLVLRRQRDKDRALASFLDVFLHRAASLFHRAWEKYRLPIRHEQAAMSEAGPDPISWSLFCLAGMGTERLRDRTGVHPEAALRFSGYVARTVRPAVNLEAMLSDYFDLPVEVVQFRGEWLVLSADERTTLPSEKDPRGRHNRLGRDVILGSAAWNVEGRFRLRVGPVPYSAFRRLMPDGDMIRPFCSLVRVYAGPSLAFDVEPVLAAGEAPPCVLGAEGDARPRLGWNTWIRTNRIEREFDGIGFSLDRVRNALV